MWFASQLLGLRCTRRATLVPDWLFTLGRAFTSWQSASDTVAQLTQGYRSQTSEVPAVPQSEIIVILALAARSWAVSQLVITWWSVRILWLLATCRVTAPYWACQLVSFRASPLAHISNLQL